MNGELIEWLLRAGERGRVIARWSICSTGRKTSPRYMRSAARCWTIRR
jgi:hypothetical protein